MLLRTLSHVRRRRLEYLLACLVLCPLGVALAGKVKEVVVRYDDGTEEVLLAAAPKVPPLPLPEPTPPRPEPDVTPPAANAAPAVSLVTPASAGAIRAAAPGHFVLRADAADADGVVRKVEFWAGDRLIDAPTVAPFMTAWTDVVPGTYELTAKAFDDEGGSARSAPIVVTIVAPAPGRTITVNAGQSINAAAMQAGPGDTVLVKPGVYLESVIVRRGGTAERPVSFMFEPGATIDATRFLTAFIDGGGAEHVVVTGLHVTGCTNELRGHNAAVRTGGHWRLQDAVVENVKGTGIGASGRFVTLLRCTARNNGQNGISSSKGKVVLLKDCVITNNNTGRHNPASEGGGGKWARTDTVYVTGLDTHDNLGPGIWFDISNRNYAIVNSAAHGNRGRKNKWEGPGFMTEISQGPGRIENNVTYDNEGAGIQVCEAQDLTIRNNTLINDNLEMRNLPRDDGDWRLENVVIEGNRFKNGYIDTSDAGESWRTTRAAEWKLTIDGNTYDNPASKQLVKWGKRKLMTLDEVRQTLGLEQAGQTAPIAVPAPASAPSSAPAAPPAPPTP